MCRVVGYIGPRLRLGALVDDAPHALLVQSYRAKELETSVVAADGWGAAWYLDDDAVPCVYRSTLPIWGDANRLDLDRAIASRCLLGAVRSATDPLSIAIGNTQPFRFDRLSFLHNGYLQDFAARWMRPMREALSERAYRSLSGVSDSEHIFALIVDEWLSRADGSPATRLHDAVAAAHARLVQLGQKLGARALLTWLVSDGNEILAVRSAHQATAPSLYVLHEPERGAVYLASEPLDPQRPYRALAPGRILVARAGQTPTESELR